MAKWIRLQHKRYLCLPNPTKDHPIADYFRNEGNVSSGFQVLIYEAATSIWLYELKNTFKKIGIDREVELATFVNSPKVQLQTDLFDVFS